MSTPLERLSDEFHEFVNERFAPIEKQVLQWTGGWKVIVGIGTIAGIVGVFFGVLAYFTEPH